MCPQFILFQSSATDIYFRGISCCQTNGGLCIVFFERTTSDRSFQSLLVRRLQDVADELPFIVLSSFPVCFCVRLFLVYCCDSAGWLAGWLPECMPCVIDGHVTVFLVFLCNPRASKCVFDDELLTSFFCTLSTTQVLLTET